MANTSSAKNANRTSKRRNSINTKIKNEFKEARKKFKKALDTKGKKDAPKLLNDSYSRIDSAVKKGVIHKNTGARYKSRLAKALKKSE